MLEPDERVADPVVLVRADAADVPVWLELDEADAGLELLAPGLAEEDDDEDAYFPADALPLLSAVAFGSVEELLLEALVSADALEVEVDDADRLPDPGTLLDAEPDLVGEADVLLDPGPVDPAPLSPTFSAVRSIVTGFLPPLAGVEDEDAPGLSFEPVPPGEPVPPEDLLSDAICSPPEPLLVPRHSLYTPLRRAVPSRRRELRAAKERLPRNRLTLP
ncbi:hypothetical protein [Roseibium denhamense]|uniref:Uncharacterized protein n=1 Tax=Roseibium denhamense TaxID=76305 RepID=A0ABY1P7X4_9HYPH|nr:hypothetical protein [Roseibium denhamense]SMP28446.1 hypothetical protein SAMN06265374_2924 [Roseibium denhamense]